MKLLVAFALVAALPLIAGEFRLNDQTDVAAAHSVCRMERKPPDDLYKKFINMEFPLHESTPCYVQCLLEKLHMYNITKGFIVENILRQLTHQHEENTGQVMRTFRVCVGDRPSVKNETCQFVFSSFNCFMVENRDMVIKSFNF